MATVFDSVSIVGLRVTHFRQLLDYLQSWKESGDYYGNKEQFMKRQDELEEWLVKIISYAKSEGIIIPKKKAEG